MVRETLGLSAHLHFREPSALPKNLALPLGMRLGTPPPSFFRAIQRAIAQSAADSRHLDTDRGSLFCGLLVICLTLQSFLSSVELPLLRSSVKPAASEYVDWRVHAHKRRTLPTRCSSQLQVA